MVFLRDVGAELVLVLHLVVRLVGEGVGIVWHPIVHVYALLVPFSHVLKRARLLVEVVLIRLLLVITQSCGVGYVLHLPNYVSLLDPLLLVLFVDLLELLLEILHTVSYLLVFEVFFPIRI